MKEKLGIYIHIPFCVKKCNYCDFLSLAADSETQEKYVEAVLREIQAYQSKIQCYEVETIYFGGGTPSAIDAKHITSILDAIKGCIHHTLDGKEVTIEVNPGTIDGEKLKQYKEAGFHRLSMGLQSTNNEHLKELGRIHTFEVFSDNFQLARVCGFDNISVDLMSALPNQTMEQWEADLEHVIQLQPEHISVYSLILEEGTSFCEKYGENGPMRHLLPKENMERKMYHKAKERLKEAGYFSYEIANFAKKGFESQHNSSYWIGRPYLGLGLGASSYFEGERYNNTEILSEYCNVNYDFIGERKAVIQLSEKEEMEEFMFLGLRMTDGIEEKAFLEEFSTSVEDVYGFVLNQLQRDGWIERGGGRIWLTEAGVDVSNTILSEFLL